MDQKHISLSICDYNRNNVCDLYDSDLKAAGQAYNIVVTEEIKMGWKELSFDLPFVIDTERNFRWNYIKNDYQVRQRIGNETDWYKLQTPKKTKNGKAVSNTVKCVHISTNLKTKNLYLVFDDETGIGTARYLIERALTNTTWTIGTCDTFYEQDGRTEKIRSLSSNGKKGSYQLISDICDLFNAYPVYHGDTKTVDIRALSNKLPVRELYVGKNLDTLTVESNSDNIVTRLYVEGQYTDNGYVGIDDINPTGLPFLLNFDYYIENGLFSAEQQAAVEAYTHDRYENNQAIMARMASILEGENLLNDMIGQCDYVLSSIYDGSVLIYGGNATENDRRYYRGDKVHIFKETGNYRTVEIQSDNQHNFFEQDDVYALKYVTRPAGKIGAREVAIKSKEKMIESTQRKLDALFEITQDPVDRYMGNSSFISFAIRVNKNTASYQWQVKKAGSLTWENIGTNSPTLIVRASEAESNGYYQGQFRCVATNTYQGDEYSVTSKIAILYKASGNNAAAVTNEDSQKRQYYSGLITDYQTMISNIYNGTPEANGLYEAMRTAVDLMIDLDGQRKTLDTLLAEQEAIEAAFAEAMGDLLKDGYWANTNYAPGQERELYWDAVEHQKQACKPKVKYNLSLIMLSKLMGFTEELPEINAKVKIWDKELGLNDVAYVSKRTRYLDDPAKGSIEISNEDIASAITRSLDDVLGRMTQIADLVNQRNAVYERARAINDNGTLPAESLSGMLNIQEHAIESPVSTWHSDQDGGLVFESILGDSALRISGDGIQIAHDTIGTGEWNWESLLDGYGIDASYISGGYISSSVIEDGAFSSVKFDDEFMTRIYQDEQSILFEAKKTDELSATLEITASQIRSEVTDSVNGQNSSITQTASQIRAEVSDSVNGQNSSITQTASQIRAEVSDTRNGLQSSITQTASQIRAEVSDSVNGLNSSITQTASQIRSEVSDTKNNLQSSITQTASQIRSEVSDTANGLSSRITQNSNSIKLKVSKGDVATQLSVECGNVSVTGGNLVVDGYVKSNELLAQKARIDNLVSGDAQATKLWAATMSTGDLEVGTSNSGTFKYKGNTISTLNALSSDGTKIQAVLGVVRSPDVSSGLSALKGAFNSCSASSNNGVITLTFGKLGTNESSATVNFNMADTQYFRDAVSAARPHSVSNISLSSSSFGSTVSKLITVYCNDDEEYDLYTNITVPNPSINLSVHGTWIEADGTENDEGALTQDFELWAGEKMYVRAANNGTLGGTGVNIIAAKPILTFSWVYNTIGTRFRVNMNHEDSGLSAYLEYDNDSGNVYVRDWETDYEYAKLFVGW